MPFCRVTLRAVKPKSAAYPKKIKTLGDRIRTVRLDQGLLQKQIAEEIGVDTTTINNWETGRTSPALRCLPAICNFLGYDPFPQATALPNQLLRFRQLHGFSQKKLAQMLGVDPTTIGDWERGTHKPNARSRGKIRTLFRTVG